MKFAYIIMFELRSIKKTFPDLKKYIIDHFDADVFIVCQKQFENDNINLELFKDCNVVKKVIYEKPEPKEFYKNYCNVDLPLNKGNWNKPSCMQLYINHTKMIEELKPYIHNYDYFISLRVDVSFLFPFPEKKFFENVNPGIYTFKSNYCSSYGGYGMGVFIHKDFIEKYLKCYANGLNNPKFTGKLKTNPHMNQEYFLLICMKESNLKFFDIIHMNNYYTAEEGNSYTTWSTPHFNKKYNIICKKDNQVEEVYKNYDLWKNNYKWSYEDNKIFLKK
jgi:hypothetical protein